MMPHMQYLRIESEAGGLYTSNIAFVRCCWKRLGLEGKTRKLRDVRHAWVRDGLRQRQDQLALVRHFAL